MSYVFKLSALLLNIVEFLLELFDICSVRRQHGGIKCWRLEFPVRVIVIAIFAIILVKKRETRKEGTNNPYFTLQSQV